MRESKVCLILLRYKMNVTLFQKAFVILNRWAGFTEDCWTLNSLNYPCFSEAVTNGITCYFSTVAAILLGFMEGPVHVGKAKPGFWKDFRLVCVQALSACQQLGCGFLGKGMWTRQVLLGTAEGLDTKYISLGLSRLHTHLECPRRRWARSLSGQSCGGAMDQQWPHNEDLYWRCSSICQSKWT